MKDYNHKVPRVQFLGVRRYNVSCSKDFDAKGYVEHIDCRIEFAGRPLWVTCDGEVFDKNIMPDLTEISGS